MGCLVPGCDTLTDVGVEPLGLATLQVTVYPNPANGTVRVILNHGMPNATADFGLYDLAGRKVLAAEHPLNSHGFGEWRMDLSGLPPGMYLYRITDAGDRVRTGKLAIE